MAAQLPAVAETCRGADRAVEEQNRLFILPAWWRRTLGSRQLGVQAGAGPGGSQLAGQECQAGQSRRRDVL